MNTDRVHTYMVPLTNM